jgi:predicted dehydrogenase
MSGIQGFSRRGILKQAGMAAGAVMAAPYIVPSSALGRDGAVAPSERITLGVVGYGNRCRVVLDHSLSFRQIQCLAVCDVKEHQRNAAKARVDQHHGNTDCTTYSDLREMYARRDIQAVIVATGNRWHGLASIMAARAGKDVFSEKPVSLTIEEGRTLVETCRRYGTVYQAGHQRRSVGSYKFQTEVVRKELIGRLHTILCQVWAGPAIKPDEVRPVPPGLDWDGWLGQTPYHEFSNARMNSWQYFWDTAEGVLTDMGCHYTDIAQWCMGADDTGPVDFEGEAVFDRTAMSDTPITGECRSTYAGGVKLIVRQTGGFTERFIRFTGTDGWIQVDDETNVITAEPREILRLRGAQARGSWALTGDHIGDFLDCIRTRHQTVCHPEAAHRAQSICQINTIGLRLGRRLRWDPRAERFINDEQANRMLARARREPWTL